MGDCPGSPGGKALLSRCGARVQSLVSKLRSHMLCGTTKTKNNSEKRREGDEEAYVQNGWGGYAASVPS